MACVSLTTDYGLADGFVAACHGVLLRQAPGVPIVDVTHLIPPGDVRRGAAVLAQTVPHLPRGAHVAVVDPGVGTRRRAVALRTPKGFLVGPDNGLLLPAAEALGGVVEAVDLTIPAGIPATFHGRDVFAPAAAALVTGRPLAELGRPADPATLVRLPEPVARLLPAPAGAGAPRLEAEVVLVDGFGNVQLAAGGDLLRQAGLLPGERVTLARAGRPADAGGAGGDDAAGHDAAGAAAGPVVLAADVAVGVTFGSVGPGELVLYVDSAGMAALAERDGDAARRLGLRPGDLVLVARR